MKISSNTLRKLPHNFVGSSDRDCTVCGLPDRAEVHSRNAYLKSVRIGIACAIEPTGNVSDYCDVSGWWINGLYYCTRHYEVQIQSKNTEGGL